MSANTCPILSPAQARVNDAISRAQQAMLDAVDAAIEKAARQVAADFADAGAEDTPPPAAYFRAVVQQDAFCRLCGADPRTFEGGDAAIAGGVIRSNQNVALTYWGADPDDLTPR